MRYIYLIACLSFSLSSTFLKAEEISKGGFEELISDHFCGTWSCVDLPKSLSRKGFNSFRLTFTLEGEVNFEYSKDDEIQKYHGDVFIGRKGLVIIMPDSTLASYDYLIEGEVLKLRSVGDEDFMSCKKEKEIEKAE
ncbi:MAG: hypothetical protein ACI9AF_000994 [Granulosicoccus sp.]|jgi:hypothetical protein